MDKLEVEQKRKSKDNVNSLLKRLSLNRMQPGFNTDLLNQSIPDHFEFMKNQDSINEKRPSLLNDPKLNPNFVKDNKNDTIDEDTNNILDKVN